AFRMADYKKFLPRASADIIPLAIRRLEKLCMPAPPRKLFDNPLGCPGTRRLVALYWVRAIRAPMLHDGFLERVGNPEPYRVWRHHQHVISHLTEFNLGDATEQAEHWILLDRLSRTLYVGKKAEVRDVLDYQKRGIVEPLPDEAPEPGDERPLQLMGQDLRGPEKKLAKLLVPDHAELHALEAWIEEHVY
ncbi:MAG: hypothetical protein WCA04_07370, partial [Geobacteraceae bacterium]